MKIDDIVAHYDLLLKQTNLEPEDVTISGNAAQVLVCGKEALEGRVLLRCSAKALDVLKGYHCELFDIVGRFAQTNAVIVHLTSGAQAGVDLNAINEGKIIPSVHITAKRTVTDSWLAKKLKELSDLEGTERDFFNEWITDGNK